MNDGISNLIKARMGAGSRLVVYKDDDHYEEITRWLFDTEDEEFSFDDWTDLTVYRAIKDVPMSKDDYLEEDLSDPDNKRYEFGTVMGDMIISIVTEEMHGYVTYLNVMYIDPTKDLSYLNEQEYFELFLDQYNRNPVSLAEFACFCAHEISIYSSEYYRKELGGYEQNKAHALELIKDIKEKSLLPEFL